MAFWNVNCKKIGLEYLALLDATKDVDPNSKKARRSSHYSSSSTSPAQNNGAQAYSLKSATFVETGQRPGHVVARGAGLCRFCSVQDTPQN